MTNREKRHARKSWRQRKQRQKKKQTSLNRHLNDTQPPTPNTSVSDEYRQKWRSGRTRAVCYREVDKLKIKLQTKTREANRYRKRLEHIEKRTQDINSPRSKTRNLLQGKKVINAARKSLLFQNVPIMGLREKYKQAKTYRQKQLLNNFFLSNLFLRSTD